MGVSEGSKREEGAEKKKTFEGIVAEKFPYLVKNIDLQIREV